MIRALKLLIVFFLAGFSPATFAQAWDSNLPGQQVVEAGADPMPDTFRIEGSDRDLFTAIEAIFLPSGEIASDEVSRAFEEEKNLPGFLGYAMAHAPKGDECYELTTESDSADLHNSLGKDFLSALGNAEKVTLVRVTGKRAGLAGTELGTLVRVATEETLKGNAPRGAESYLFLRSGHVRIWGRSICKVDLSAPKPLEVGELALVLANHWREPFLGSNPANTIPIRDQRIELARQYRSEQLDSLMGADFLREVKRHLGTPE